jgi:hypothetical protein
MSMLHWLLGHAQHEGHHDHCAPLRSSSSSHPFRVMGSVQDPFGHRWNGDHSEPMLFKHGMHAFPMIGNWTDDIIKRKFGTLPCTYSAHGRPVSGKHKSTYASFMQRRNASFYTFTRRGAESKEFTPFLREISFPNPHFERPEVERHIVYAGGTGTAALPHIHGPAYNLLSAGSKRWIIFDANRRVGSELQALYYRRYPSGAQWKHWYKNEYERLVANQAVGQIWEFVQEAGDVVFVPDRFSHTVVNLDSVLGITVEVGCANVAGARRAG